jgi:hypothetical protein
MNDTTHTPTIDRSLREIEAELNLLGESFLVDELLICESAVGNIRQQIDNIRKRLDDPIHLVIDNFGGVLQDIDAFDTAEQAEEHFKNDTGFSYEAVCKWEADDRSYSLGLSDEFDMQIWAVTIRRDAQ